MSKLSDHPGPAGPIQERAQLRSGFETAITVNNEGPYFAVTANDAGGHPLGQSATVRIAA